MQDQEILVAPNLEAFELWMRAGNYSGETASRAVHGMRRYLAFCRVGKLNEGHSDTIITYLSECARRVKPPTLLNYYNDLNLFFFKFGYSTGAYRKNLMLPVPRPRVSPYDTEHDAPEYTEADIQRLRDACNMDSWTGYRDRALLTILWTTPLRSSEICNLRLTDIDLGLCEVHVVNGKGGVEYEVPLLEELEEALVEYREHCPYRADHLFVTTQGHAMHRWTLLQVLKRLARRAGFDTELTTHNFRHNYRSRLTESNVPIEDISALMGHRSVRMTVRYGRKVARRGAKARVLTKLGKPLQRKAGRRALEIFGGGPRLLALNEETA